MVQRFLVVSVVVTALGVTALGVTTAPRAQADPAPPNLGGPCESDLAGAMTLLPDQQTYAVCGANEKNPGVWTAVQTPFDPNDTWYSYGPSIGLHGQGMRNPNLTAGRWEAAARDPQTVCRAEQRSVVEAGVLGTPDVAQGQPGQALTVRVPATMFYLKLSGDCLWTKQ